MSKVSLDPSNGEGEDHPIVALGRRARFRVLPEWRLRLGTVVRHLTVRLLQLFAVFLLAGVPIFLLIAGIHGLGDGVRRKLEKALSGQGFDVQIHRVFFNISDGLIAEDIRLMERTPAHRLLASASRIAISPRLSQLVSGTMEIESFQLRHAILDIPLGMHEEPRLRLDHVEAKVLCPPGQVRLSEATFELCGLHVRMSGTFLNPKEFVPRPIATGGPGTIALTIESIQRELRHIRWESSPPLLEISGSGDLANSDSLRVDRATLRTGPCEYLGWHLKGITADLEYASRQLTMQQMTIEDSLGQLLLTGNADFNKSEAALEFSGSSDLSEAAKPWFKQEAVSDLTWIDPPHLDGFLTVSWTTGKPQWSGQSMFQAGRFSYRGIKMDSLSGGCVLRDGRFLMRDFQLSGAPGSLHADLMITPEDFRIRMEGAVIPQRLAPATRGKLAESFSAMDFLDPLQLKFEGNAPTSDLSLLKGTGRLALGRSSVRGAWVDSASANLQVSVGAINCSDVMVKIGEGTARGSFVYDLKNMEVRLPGIRSNVDPVIVMMWIDPHIANSLKDYRFHRPPELQVTGRVGLRDPEKNDLRVELNAATGLDYTLIARNLSFSRAQGVVRIKGQTVFVDLPVAGLFHGKAAVRAEVSIVPGNGGYGASVHLEDIDFRSLTKLYFDYDTSEGKLSGDYSFRTITGNDRAMSGSGHLLIKDGNVFAIPILGPLSTLLSDLIPGLGYQSAHRATADFHVGNGVITTKNLLIKGIGFSMIGSGDIFYLDDRMNMSMRLNVQGLPGLVLFPVSKLLEYVSDGSLKHPTWRAKRFTAPASAPSPAAPTKKNET